MRKIKIMIPHYDKGSWTKEVVNLIRLIDNSVILNESTCFKDHYILCMVSPKAFKSILFLSEDCELFVTQYE